MKCAVANCKTKHHKTKDNGETVRFFRFPRNAELQNLWVLFCQRRNSINTQNARICSEHFKREDYERNMQAEMGFSSKNVLKLKPEAVPSLRYNHKGEKSDITYQSLAPNHEAPSPIIPAEYCSIKLEELEPIEPNAFHIVKQEEFIPDKSNESISTTSQYRTMLLQDQIKSLEMEVSALRHENKELKKNQCESMATIQNLKDKVINLRFSNARVDKALRRFLTEGQIKKIRQGNDKRQCWTNEDITHALPIYAASAKAYNILVKKNYPLPSVRTMQRIRQYNSNVIIEQHFKASTEDDFIQES